MLTLQQKMDVVANNMANVSTTGFKKDTLSLEAFPDLLAQRLHDRGDNPTTRAIGSMTLFNNPGVVKTDFSQGYLGETGSATDMALDADSNAFFTIGETQSDGTVKESLTRDGSFVLTADGRLVTKNGAAVLGENGPIKLSNAQFSVRGDGTVETADAVVDKLKITRVDNPESLRKRGSNLLDTTDETKPGVFVGRVVQGKLEQSNVESVREMVDMITVLRSYEANQKMIQYQDATLDKACNEIGRVK